MTVGIIAFLRFVSVAAGALFLVCLIAFLIFPGTASSSVIFPLAIGTNLLASVGAGIGSAVLCRKDKELTEKESRKIQKTGKDEKQEGC